MIIPFFLGLFSALFCLIFFPSFHLLAFAPFLALASMQKSFLTALWLSLFSGLVIDLTTAELGFGTNALIYTLATVILYRQKMHFFSDKTLSLSIFTLLYSSLISFFLLIFRRITLSYSIAFSELLLMPLFDALYAFLWFTCPLKLVHYGRKVGWRHFFKIGH